MMDRRVTLVEILFVELFKLREFVKAEINLVINSEKRNVHVTDELKSNKIDQGEGTVMSRFSMN